MNTSSVIWFETIFDVTYLLAVWFIVFLMTRRMSSVAEEDRRVAGLIRLAFILLAAGDTGHVGFRVVATLLGGTGAAVVVFGEPMSLIGLGQMVTAFTVTLFYMLFVYIWQARNRQHANGLTNLLLAVGVVRLILMALPANNWGSAVPPQPFSLYRNIPLMLQGFGVLGLILYSAYKENDVTFKWIGWMVFTSFAFYTPVILLAQRIPMIGMLMIPKTCAYLAVAWIAYRSLWKHSGSHVNKNSSVPVAE